MTKLSPHDFNATNHFVMIRLHHTLLHYLTLLLLTCALPVLGMDSIALADLPPEAQHTLRLIDAGGPFPFQRDGVIFGNREKLLPVRPRGYYREYTVTTPGVKNRGARRIITGNPFERYYTDNHYQSFYRIRP